MFRKIYDSIKIALSSSFKKKIKKIKNPYYRKDTAKNIVKIIEKNILYKPNVTKKFYDIK